MAYYVYINSETKGPFTVSTIKENLNTGIWDPVTLCCKHGENEWKPIADLFTVEFVPKEKGISDLPNQLLNRTKQIALSALKASPFRGFNRPPPTPSTANIMRSPANSGLVYANPTPAGQGNSSAPRPAPLNTPVQTPQINPTYQATGLRPAGMPIISRVRKPAPVVIEPEDTPQTRLYWALGALGITAFVFTLLYILITWIYGSGH